MSRAQKFGTFGGVFVPSVLTILGVIMYLRLGWVVGNAGLIGTISIILIAHVISITTGLSVSSIATDKKIKAGGIYYVLSRSLGLPIGGAIGIALFIATALSIAMYIVGFGESFNHAIGLSHPGMDVAERIDNLRITGTITLVLVTTIALVSTSLAIKTQYYILGAIALSIVSVIAGGLFTDHGFTAASLTWFAEDGSASMEVVFAIFFPAVTGFTAGIAMSGDLKDPKKSIPIGTMAAIGVGLVVYISLAIFLSTTIDANALRQDTNILAKIALFSAYGAPFLMAGIWGATLSSALGGILGGPRILQAMSIDKVTPKLFGKGVGKSNEPRNALLFSFVIAEAGILIGELDLIAPIVSMFYLAAYGFINLTSALESWSGSDFRPTFKIPKAVSLLGAIATFGVMFKLDMIAMFASFIVIGLIFLYLTKKQINLGFSDVWQGVWSEIVRMALFRIGQNTPDKRSWRPNIILFSGSTDKRPHLLEYGRRLVGRLGLLSNFDLVEDPKADVIFVRREQAVEISETNKGIFTRRYSCQDVYSGIERIAETYGFSGLEPNTILIGWARYTQDPLRFSLLIKKFQQLDYSLLIMDYDQQVGFGEKKRIDIWWEGTGRHVSFALTISRFLSTSDDWQEALIRLFILADTSQVDDAIISEIVDQAQEELRVKLDLKIINSALDRRPLYDTVKSESSEADLVYLELPELVDGSEREFFLKTDILCKEIGSVILYKASKDFDIIDLGLGKRAVSYANTGETMAVSLDLPLSSNIPIITPPQQSLVADNFSILDDTIVRIIQDYFKESLIPYANKNIQLIDSIQMLIVETYDHFGIQAHTETVVKSLTREQRELLTGINKLIEDFQLHEIRHQQQILLTAIDKIKTDFEDIISKCPPHLLLTYNGLLTDEDYSNLDWSQRLKHKLLKRSPQYKFQFQRLAAVQLNQHLQQAFFEIQKQINQDSNLFANGLRKYLRRTMAGLQNLKIGDNNQADPKNIALEKSQIDKRFEDLKANATTKISAYRDYLVTDHRIHLQQFVDAVEKAAVNKMVRSQLKSPKHWNRLHQQHTDTIGAWGYNQPLNFNVHKLELGLLSIQNDLWQLMVHVTEIITRLPDEKVLKKVNQLISILQGLHKQFESGKFARISGEHEVADLTGLAENTLDFIEACKELPTQLPKQMQVPNLQNTSTDPSEEIDTLDISPREVVNYLIYTNLIAPFEVHSSQLLPIVTKVDHTISDVLQVVSLSLDSKAADIESSPDQHVMKVVEAIDGEISRLQEGKRLIEEHKGLLLEGLRENFKVVSKDLNAHTIIKSALDFDYYLRNQKQTQVINKFTGYSQKVRNYILAGLTKLYYRRSEGLIAAKRFQENKREVGYWTDRLSKTMNEIIPHTQVLEDLPFYYKQLFLRPHSVGRELWLVRNHESNGANEAVSHYEQDRSGGLLILGTPLSGKTYLSEFIAKSNFNIERIYHVNPPEAGSIDVKIFQQTIKKSLKYYGELDAAFDQMEDESVLILNDMELWWERHVTGFKVLEVLVDLIDTYSHKCLFIVNMNAPSFQLINSIRNIEDDFFKIIKIHPFNAEEIKDVILARHQTSRLKLEVEGKQEEEISKWNYAKLFTRYFDISHGNIGVALQQWMSNIKAISEDGVIHMEYPSYPDLEVLGNIDKDRAILLIQLIIHKRLTADRLSHLLEISEQDMNKKLQILKRLDVLREKNGVWEINRFLQPFLITAFKEDLLI